MLFKTDGRQTLVVKEDNKLSDTIAQHHTLFLIIRQFMLLVLSNDQTLSRLGHSELLVFMSKCDLDVNLQASDWDDGFFIECCVWSLDTLQHMPFG